MIMTSHNNNNNNNIQCPLCFRGGFSNQNINLHAATCKGPPEQHNSRAPKQQQMRTSNKQPHLNKENISKFTNTTVTASAKNSRTIVIDIDDDDDDNNNNNDNIKNNMNNETNTNRKRSNLTSIANTNTNMNTNISTITNSNNINTNTGGSVTVSVNATRNPSLPRHNTNADGVDNSNKDDYLNHRSIVYFGLNSYYHSNNSSAYTYTFNTNTNTSNDYKRICIEDVNSVYATTISNTSNSNSTDKEKDISHANNRINSSSKRSRYSYGDAVKMLIETTDDCVTDEESGRDDGVNNPCRGYPPFSSTSSVHVSASDTDHLCSSLALVHKIASRAKSTDTTKTNTVSTNNTIGKSNINNKATVMVKSTASTTIANTTNANTSNPNITNANTTNANTNMTAPNANTNMTAPNANTNMTAPNPLWGRAIVVRPEGATARDSYDIENSQILFRLEYKEQIYYDVIRDFEDDDEDTVKVERIHIFVRGPRVTANADDAKSASWIDGWASLTGRTIDDHDPLISITHRAKANDNSRVLDLTKATTKHCPICDGPCPIDEDHCSKCFDFIHSQF